MERRNIAVANCDAKNERTNVKEEEEEEEDHRVETKSDRVQELQVQMQPQMQQTDTRADRWARDPSVNRQRQAKPEMSGCFLRILIALLTIGYYLHRRWKQAHLDFSFPEH